MCATDQALSTPEPQVSKGKIEISFEETKDLAKTIAEFAESAGFDDTHRQAAHILLLCLHSSRPRHPDLAQLCELVGCDREFATRILNRVREQKIFESFNWPNEGGEAGLMADTMVATGVLERRLSDDESDIEYRMAPLFVDEYVKHESGRGSGWFIAAEKHDEEGRQFVRLGRTQHTLGGGGKWRDASSYVRAR